jgi:CDGSH-type Zn-finger protein/uncharacterized Fe-S cluster protein YjdI
MSGKPEEYPGARVTVRFDGKKCIHSRNCVLGDPRVFVPNVSGPWIHPEAAPVERVAEVAHTCPSGAITYERNDGMPGEQPPLVNTVRVLENGPLAFRAEMRFDGGGSALRATLCRCGASNNKPFCDNSHKSSGFIATGEPASQESQPLAQRNGVLEVIPVLDGPLHVKGSIEVVSGTGRTIHRMVEAWFCRCGGSSKKPFCDGSHKRNGFKADGRAPLRK